MKSELGPSVLIFIPFLAPLITLFGSVIPFIADQLRFVPISMSFILVYLEATSKCGLISLDSNGGARSSISTMITGWLGSFWARFTCSLHLLKSVLPLMWKTIWALLGICSSISGWAKTYFLSQGIISIVSAFQNIGVAFKTDFFYLSFFKNWTAVMMGILRKVLSVIRWWFPEIIKSTLASIAASKKRLSSGSPLITFNRWEGLTRIAWLLIVSISLSAVSLVITLWNLGRAITSISSSNIWGEITNMNFASLSELTIFLQEWLLSKPEINTLVSITTFSILFSAVGYYFFSNFLSRDRKFLESFVNISKNFIPALAQSLLFKFTHQLKFFFNRQTFHNTFHLRIVKFQSYLGHIRHLLFTPNIPQLERKVNPLSLISITSKTGGRVAILLPVAGINWGQRLFISDQKRAAVPNFNLKRVAVPNFVPNFPAEDLGLKAHKEEIIQLSGLKDMPTRETILYSTLLPGLPQLGD